MIKRYKDALYLFERKQADAEPGLGSWHDVVLASDHDSELERLRRDYLALERNYDQLARELAEARELAADVIARWSGRIDYYGHPVLDSDVATRLHGFLAKGEEPPAQCTCPSGGAWADLNQAHLPQCPRGNLEEGER